MRIVHADFNRHFEEGGLVNALNMTLKQHPQWSREELMDRFLVVKEVKS